MPRIEFKLLALQAEESQAIDLLAGNLSYVIGISANLTH